jgi:hypothetical protein
MTAVAGGYLAGDRGANQRDQTSSQGGKEQYDDYQAN